MKKYLVIFGLLAATSCTSQGRQEPSVADKLALRLIESQFEQADAVTVSACRAIRGNIENNWKKRNLQPVFAGNASELYRSKCLARSDLKI